MLTFYHMIILNIILPLRLFLYCLSSTSLFCFRLTFFKLINEKWGSMVWVSTWLRIQEVNRPPPNTHRNPKPVGAWNGRFWADLEVWKYNNFINLFLNLHTVQFIVWGYSSMNSDKQIMLYNHDNNRDIEELCHNTATPPPRPPQSPSCCLFVVNPCLHPQALATGNLLEPFYFVCFSPLCSFMQQPLIESTVCSGLWGGGWNGERDRRGAFHIQTDNKQEEVSNPKLW